MDRFMRVLAGLLGRSAGLLPAARRDWPEAVLAEAGEVPAGAGRVAWLCGGLWLVAREVVMRRVIGVLAFAAAAAGMVWIGWPGSSSNSAVPVNRMYIVATVVLLAVLPLVIRRYVGPVRGGWGPRAARVGGYGLVLALIAAKTVKDRYGSKLGAYFAVVPGVWALEIVLLLVIAAYVAGLLILTSQRIRLTRWGLSAGIGLGVITAGVLYPLAPLGANVDPTTPSLKWWGLAALALPVAAGLLVGRLAARDARPAALAPEQHGARQGALAASCAMATAALLLAVLTSVTIALFPHHVPLQSPPPPPGGGCETCDPNSVVIPPGLRHEYWVELSVGQAGQLPLAALLLAPLFGAGLGALAGGLASRSPGTLRRGAGGPHALSPPAPSAPPGRRLWASDADRDQVVDTLKTAFGQGRLTKDELDARVGHALTSQTCADLAALTADLPAGLTAAPPPCQPPRPPMSKVVAGAALIIPPLVMVAAALIVGSQPLVGVSALVVLVFFMAWIVAAAQLIANWHDRRSRREPPGISPEPGTPAVGE